MKDTTYKQCVRCIMDTTDPEISFNQDGVCNHCEEFDSVTSKQWFPNSEGEERFSRILQQIKSNGKNNDYDCIIGLSGGIDSCYLALKAKDWGLRPLVVHVDTGWNSELAVANIEQIVKRCDYDLHTHVVDWEEMRDLQLAYLRSGLANQDVPQDHVIFASLYKFAIQNGINTVLSGGNTATESVFPKAWHHSAMDCINLRAVYKRYGSGRLKSYNTVSFFECYIWFPFIRRMKVVRPLNFMPYNKDEAILALEKAGWRSYGRKHGESIFTKLFQNYYLPQKHGIDKRIAHLSSLILSAQITREEALEEVRKPLYDPQELEQDIVYLCKKLGISREEFADIMKSPARHYSEFNNWDGRYALLKKGQRLVESMLGTKVSAYT